MLYVGTTHMTHVICGYNKQHTRHIFSLTEAADPQPGVSVSLARLTEALVVTALALTSLLAHAHPLVTWPASSAERPAEVGHS